MGSRLTWLVVAVGLFALACKSNGDGGLVIPDNPSGGGGGDAQTMTAREFYTANVHSALDLTCTWCHAAAEAGETPPGNAPQWLSLDPQQSYDNIDDYGSLIAHPKNSLLLLQGEHMGPALQPKQVQIVEQWLTMEVAERDLATPDDPIAPDGPPANSAEEALTQFGACMTRELWDLHEMNLLAHNQTAGWGPCRGCHNRGFAGAFLDDDETLTYEQNKKLPYMLKIVTAQVSAAGVFEDLVPSERMVFKGSEICTYADEALCHPKFALNPNIAANLNAFFTTVHTRWTEGLCDAPVGGAGGAGGGAAQ